MTAARVIQAPAPVTIICARLTATVAYEKGEQTAFAIIGALEQSGWVIVRKRHQR